MMVESGKRAQTIRRMFSSIAGSYDFLNHFLSLSVDRYWRRRVVRTALGPRYDQNHVPLQVLDICTGTGDLAFAFAKDLRRSCRITGLDFSHEMLCLARRKQMAIKCKSNPVVFAEGDALKLPFADDAFDISSVAFGLRNFVDRPAGVQEMARVVRPGGQVIILEFSQPRMFGLRRLYGFYLNRILPWIGNHFTQSEAYSYLADTVGAFPEPAEVQGWMEQAGLANVQYERLTGGIVVLYRGIVA